VTANVLIPHRTRQALETYARLGFYEGYWSPWIVEEMARGVTWRWMRTNSASQQSQDELSRRATVAMRHLEPTLPHPAVWPALQDAGDHPVWAAAVLAGADYVVSDNTRDFPPRDASGVTRYGGIAYLTASAFIQGMEDGTI